MTTATMLEENVPASDTKIPHLSLNGYKNLILDIGGVVLNPNLGVNYGTVIPPYQFKRILRSNTWFEYQMGKLSVDQAYSILAKENNYPQEEIRKFTRKARESMLVIQEFFELAKSLKGKMKLFCMTNSPAEDFEIMMKMFPHVFAIFDKCFTSAAAGMRKPNINFYKHVLQEAGINASESIFIDDYLANVMTAESVGITSILATDNPQDAVKLLVFHLRSREERIAAARDILAKTTKGDFFSKNLTHESNKAPVVLDHFILAEILKDERFLPTDPPLEAELNNIFLKKDQNADNSAGHKNFSKELDTYSIGLATFCKFSRVSMDLVSKVLDNIEPTLQASDEGLLQTYFNTNRPRLEPVGQMNYLYLFHLAGRTQFLKPTEDFLFSLLHRRAYARGTVHYQSAEAFLFHLARLVFAFRPHYEKAGFVELLTSRVRERVGMEGDAFSLAMRVLVCNMCSVEVNRDIEKLAYLQNVNGSFDACPVYKNNNGDPKSCFGTEALTTGFAVVALESQKPSTECYKWI